MRTAALVLLMAAAALGQDAAARLREKVEACSRRVSERFVFFPGGSGVLVGADGYCLTNHHVAGERKSSPVTLFTGEELMARRVATDETGDLALFKVDPPGGRPLPFIELGDSDALEVGQYVLACGDPFSIALPDVDGRRYPSVSLGVVSALHRTQGVDPGSPGTPVAYFDCIQTDAAVNPGNSGGPLVTLDGRLVGINGRIATRFGNRVNSGVGFAISSNQIRAFLPALKRGGEVYHGAIDGLELPLGEVDGASVGEVVRGSTADLAGFRAGDLVVAVNGRPVPTGVRFLGAISALPEEAEATVRVKRDGEERDLKVTLDRLPLEQGYLGVSLEDLKEGVTVMLVRPASPADQAGLREGDVISRLNGREAGTRRQCMQRIGASGPGRRLRITVLRKGLAKDLEAVLSLPPRVR